MSKHSHKSTDEAVITNCFNQNNEDNLSYNNDSNIIHIKEVNINTNENIKKECSIKVNKDTMFNNTIKQEYDNDTLHNNNKESEDYILEEIEKSKKEKEKENTNYEENTTNPIVINSFNRDSESIYDAKRINSNNNIYNIDFENFKLENNVNISKTGSNISLPFIKNLNSNHTLTDSDNEIMKKGISLPNEINFNFLYQETNEYTKKENKNENIKEETENIKEKKENIKEETDILNEINNYNIEKMNDKKEGEKGNTHEDHENIKIYIHDIKKNEDNNKNEEKYEIGYEKYNDKTRLYPHYKANEVKNIPLHHLKDSNEFDNTNENGNNILKNEYVDSVTPFSLHNNNSIQNDLEKICSKNSLNKNIDTFKNLCSISTNSPSEKEKEFQETYEDISKYINTSIKETEENMYQNSSSLNSLKQQTYESNDIKNFISNATFHEIKGTKLIETNDSISNQWDTFKKNLEELQNETADLGEFELNKNNYTMLQTSQNNSLHLSFQNGHSHANENSSSSYVNSNSSSCVNSFSTIVPSSPVVSSSPVIPSSPVVSSSPVVPSSPVIPPSLSINTPSNGRMNLHHEKKKLGQSSHLPNEELIKKETMNININTEEEIKQEKVNPERGTTLKIKSNISNLNKIGAKGINILSHLGKVVKTPKGGDISKFEENFQNSKKIDDGKITENNKINDINKVTDNSKMAKVTKTNDIIKPQEINKMKKTLETNKTNRAARVSADMATSYSKCEGNTTMNKEKGMNRIGKLERHSIGSPIGNNNIITSNKNSSLYSNNMQDKDITYNMNVVIRCRPMSTNEKNEGAKPIINVLDNKIVVLLDPIDNTESVLRQNRSREKRYAFDYAFDENSTTQDVYDNCVKCLIDGVIKGFNSTVFAYGATGAGKTHTIIGYKDEPGIMTMILQDLFEKMKSLKVLNEYKVMCSFLEIYNENIVDLLNPSGEYLDLREDPIKGVTVSNLFEVCTTSVEEIIELIHTGNKNRTQEPTDANKTSSRSHGILQIIVEETEKGQGTCQQTKRGKLCVIDLAGSERASQTNNKGIRMLEGANINRSLLALGNVINALVSRSKGTSKSNFIPFRDSKLTRLLKDSLGGNCRTVMIANISPSHLSYEDTHNTLKYANRAKNIKSVVTANAVTVKHHVSMYINIIEKLKNEIEFLKEQLNHRDRTSTSLSSDVMLRSNSNNSNCTQYDYMLSSDKNDYSKEDLIGIISQMKKENDQLKINLQKRDSAKLGEEKFFDCKSGSNDLSENPQIMDNININLYKEEILKLKEELENVKNINEKLFSDNKNFQNKLYECSEIIKHFQAVNGEYKRNNVEYLKQIDECKVIMRNHDINHIQMKKQIDHWKKKCQALEENKEDSKEYAEQFEKWKNDITVLLNERKEIQKVIFNVEKQLIENIEMGEYKISAENVKMLKENKTKMNVQLKENIINTNKLIKDLLTQIKDEKMKNFLYLFYTNKVLIQEKEQLQGFFELSSTVINQRDRHIEYLKNELKQLNKTNN